MPAVTQHQETITHAGKKRRRDDDAQQPNTPSYGALFRKDTPLNLPPTNLYLHNPSEQHGFAAFPPHHPPPRRHIPFPSSKRLKETPEDRPPHSRLHSPTTQHNNAAPKPPSSRELLQETDPNSRPTPARQTSTTSTPAPLLSRCHICHRKPTKKSDLDSYGDCDRCGRRTCYICMRECPGWMTTTGGYASASFEMADVGDEEEEARVFSQGGTDLFRRRLESGKDDGMEGWASGGHREKICAGCCVERGEDGDVVCYGCLPFLEG